MEYQSHHIFTPAVSTVFRRCADLHDYFTVLQTHFLVIPKARGNLASLSTAKPDDEATLGHLLFVAGQVAKQEGLDRASAS